MARKRNITVFYLWAVFFIIIGLLIIERPAYAAGVVNTCNEANLITAISGGGNVTFACSGTITLTSAITISANTTIDGTGQNVTISGNNAVQLFIVNAGITLTLTNLTLTNGYYSGAFGGGAIANYGTLDISGCTFSNNRALGVGSGGVVYCYSSAVNITISNSTFSENSAFEAGGAIFIAFNTTLNISESTFSGNTASYGAALGLSGGNVTIDRTSFINNIGQTEGAIDHYMGILTITNSTFEGNQAEAGVGGALVSLQTLILANSTFYGNSSTDQGGAVYLDGNTATITNCTLANNSASSGGAIYLRGSTLTLTNTIVADSPSGGNCSGTIVDGGNNLQFGGTVANSCGGSIPTPGTDPLGSNVLANNGGPTETIALPEGSPAIDAANDAVCAAVPINGVDQRGVTRPQYAHCDIGAYELLQQDLTAVPTLNQWGIIVFMVFAGLGAVYYMRKQKTAKS